MRMGVEQSVSVKRTVDSSASRGPATRGRPRQGFAIFVRSITDNKGQPCDDPARQFRYLCRFPGNRERDDGHSGNPWTSDCDFRWPRAKRRRRLRIYLGFVVGPMDELAYNRAPIPITPARSRSMPRKLKSSARIWAFYGTLIVAATSKKAAWSLGPAGPASVRPRALAAETNRARSLVVEGRAEGARAVVCFDEAPGSAQGQAAKFFKGKNGRGHLQGSEGDERGRREAVGRRRNPGKREQRAATTRGEGAAIGKRQGRNGRRGGKRPPRTESRTAKRGPDEPSNRGSWRQRGTA